MSAEALISALAVGCTVIGALALLAYQSGRLSVRVEQLEQWRGEMRSDMSELRVAIGELKDLIVHGGA